MATSYDADDVAAAAIITGVGTLAVGTLLGAHGKAELRDRAELAECHAKGLAVQLRVAQLGNGLLSERVAQQLEAIRKLQDELAQAKETIAAQASAAVGAAVQRGILGAANDQQRTDLANILGRTIGQALGVFAH